MTDERKKAQSREEICKTINDLIISGATWAQIASKLKEDEVHIRRGVHGGQKKTWTSWSTYSYYRKSPSEMKLPEEDWPKQTPKAPKKAATKKKAAPKKKAATKKKAAPKKRKAPVKKAVLKKKAARPAMRFPDNRPARLSIDITDEGAKISFNYRGEVTEEVNDVCTELLTIFNRLNGDAS